MAGAPTAVTAEASVTSVAQVMRDQGIGLVLVMDDDDLMGLVSDRDLLVGAVADGADPQRMPVAQALHGELITSTWTRTWRRRRRRSASTRPGMPR
ncbi:CBS domain-containing protein [Streptomyces sp. FXJ1.172]|uniref:CBS domain-containing protein n=1 Tax=Streptomyces sp. FXJ1.172 TaxID=710705 RepID=UPI003FA76FBA